MEKNSITFAILKNLEAKRNGSVFFYNKKMKK